MNFNDFEQSVVNSYLKLPRSIRDRVYLSVKDEKIDDPKTLGALKKENGIVRVVLIYQNFKGSDEKIEMIMDRISEMLSTENIPNSQSEYYSSISDSPFCSNCGHLTVRSATCFKCLNCGNSEGCS